MGQPQKCRFKQNEVPLVWQPSSKALHLSHVTGTSFWPNKKKVQLFICLSQAVIEASSQVTDVMVSSTYDDLVLVNKSHSQLAADFDTIMPCNHQEADSRIFLHLSHNSHSNAFIRTVDSPFSSPGLMELWIGFGTGKGFQHIPVHEFTQIAIEKSLSLPLFHSFTGCDTSSFLDIGMKGAWAVWQACPYLIETLLSDYPWLLTIDSVHMACFEHWSVIMYSKSSGPCSRVNDARRQLFIHGTW